MGVLSRFFPHKAKPMPVPPEGYYTTFTESAPAFSAWEGTLYDQLLTRAAVERFAVACSSLKPEVAGSEKTKPKARALFGSWPNEQMTWPTFLRRVATLLEVDTCAFVVASVDRAGDIVGLWPIKPTYIEVCEWRGAPWWRFYLATGEVLPIEFSLACVLSRFQYESDLFGSGNDALDPTLRLMDAQRQAEELAVKNGARIRFIGRVTGMTHEVDLEEKRQRFFEQNLGPRNQSGILIYDNTFDNIEQLKEQHYVLEQEEMDRISNAVYAYHGINEDILQNKFNEATWTAYYEGKVKPFAVQLSEGLTKMLFTPVERRHGNYVTFSSNRLDFADLKKKLDVVTMLSDRGYLSINEGRELFQMPPVTGGDVRPVRGEYRDASEDGQMEEGFAGEGGDGDADSE